MIDIPGELKENNAVFTNIRDSRWPGRFPFIPDSSARKETGAMSDLATSSADPDSASAGQDHERERGIDDRLSEVRVLLERGDLGGARAALAQLAAAWPHSKRVQRMARMLAPAVLTFRRGEPRPSRETDYQWLRDHVHEYPGQWVALLDGQLVGAGEELGRVLEQARSTGRPEEVLLHFQPSNQNWHSH